MTTDADVRAWGRDQGIEMPPRGKLAPTWHEQFRAAHPELDDDDAGDAPPEDTGETPPALPPAAEDTGETRPRDPRPRRFALKKKPAGRPRRRVSLEGFASAGWAALAGITAQSGLTPTSRVLALQAPVAGVIVEDALKGSMADRLLQPIARAADRGGSAAALLGPPVLVTALSMHPELAPRLVPVLRMCLRQWLMVAGPAMKRQQAKEEKAAESMGIAAGEVDSLVDTWINEIFAEPEQQPEPVPDAA